MKYEKCFSLLEEPVFQKWPPLQAIFPTPKRTSKNPGSSKPRITEFGVPPPTRKGCRPNLGRPGKKCTVWGPRFTSSTWIYLNESPMSMSYISYIIRKNPDLEWHQNVVTRIWPTWDTPNPLVSQRRRLRTPLFSLTVSDFCDFCDFWHVFWLATMNSKIRFLESPHHPPCCSWCRLTSFWQNHKMKVAPKWNSRGKAPAPTLPYAWLWCLRMCMSVCVLFAVSRHQKKGFNLETFWVPQKADNQEIIQNYDRKNFETSAVLPSNNHKNKVYRYRCYLKWNSLSWREPFSTSIQWSPGFDMMAVMISPAASFTAMSSVGSVGTSCACRINGCFQTTKVLLKHIWVSTLYMSYVHQDHHICIRYYVSQS